DQLFFPVKGEGVARGQGLAVPSRNQTRTRFRRKQSLAVSGNENRTLALFPCPPPHRWLQTEASGSLGSLAPPLPPLPRTPPSSPRSAVGAACQRIWSSQNTSSLSSSSSSSSRPLSAPPSAAGSSRTCDPTRQSTAPAGRMRACEPGCSRAMGSVYRRRRQSGERLPPSSSPCSSLCSCECPSSAQQSGCCPSQASARQYWRCC
ncbi:hypothetical protein T484DRAFT_3640989, partial [Baffinella frigidus]